MKIDKLLFLTALRKYLSNGIEISKIPSLLIEDESFKASERKQITGFAIAIKKGKSLGEASVGLIPASDTAALKIADTSGSYEAVFKYLIDKYEIEDRLSKQFKAKLLPVFIMMFIAGLVTHLPEFYQDHIDFLTFCWSIFLPSLLLIFLISVLRLSYNYRYSILPMRLIQNISLFQHELESLFFTGFNLYYKSGIDFYSASHDLVEMMPSKKLAQQLESAGRNTRLRQESMRYYFRLIEFIPRQTQQLLSSAEHSGSLYDELERQGKFTKEAWQLELAYSTTWASRMLYPLALLLLFKY